MAIPSIDTNEFINRLKILTETISEGVVITDADEEIVWANNAFEQICSLSFSDIKGKKPRIFQGPDTDINTKRKIREHLDRHEPVTVEILNYKPDNTPYWIHLSITPIKNSSGELTNFICFEHDITREKEMEIDLEESEKHYQELFDQNPSPLWICDVSTLKFLEVNNAAIENYGYSREEFLTMSLEDIKPAEDIIELKKTFLTKAEKHKEGTWVHIKKNGETIYVEVKTHRIRHKGRLASLALLNDVTDKINKEKEIEKLNKQLENRLKFIEQVSDNIPGAVFQTIYHTDGKEELTFIGNGFEEFWGVPVKEVWGDPTIRFKYIHPDDLESMGNAINDAIKNQNRINNKFRYIKHKTNEIIWARVTAIPVKLQDGRVILTGVIMNITETEKFYTELEKANERFEYVSKAANELIWDLDLATNVMSFAGNYKEMFGYAYPGDKIELSKIMHFLHPDDNARVNEGVANAIKDTTRKYWEDSYRVIKKDGSIVYTHDRAYIIRDRKTLNATRLVGVIQDITRRKNDEDAILEQMRKVNIVIDSITDVFYVVDRDYNLLFVNETTEKLTGKSAYDLIGKNVWDVFEDAQLNLPQSMFYKCFADNTPAEFEMVYRGRIFEVYLQPSEIGLVVSGKDVTVKKSQEEEIRKNAKFMFEISNSMDGFIFQTEYNKDGIAKLNYASEKGNDYSGFSINQVMNDKTKILQSIHPDDIELLQAKRKEMITNLTNLDVKFRFVNGITNEIKWVKAGGTPTRLENGSTIVNGIVIDITESEKHYSQLEEANTRYEYLSKATHETIWEVDLALHIVKLGGGYKEMYGHEFPDNIMTYDQWQQAVHPDDLPIAIKCMQDTLNNPDERYCEFSYRIIQPGGKVVDVFERAYVIYDEKTNTPVNIIGSTRDVTELKEIQKEKDNLMTDLLKRNKVLEQFTFMVSHNLRAPIANMLGINSLLEDKTLDENSRNEMLLLNHKSVLRLDAVISDMNEILSIRKKINEDKTEIVFEELLNEIKDVVKSEIKSSAVEITSDFKNLKSIYTIKSYIYSIFQNLISNSIKYKRDNSSHIKISSKKDAEFFYLTFKDDGIGIDLAKNANKIFGLYNRFHLSKEGKGMGLFMVKNQVEGLDGEITVESKVGTGTKFTIKFKK